MLRQLRSADEERFEAQIREVKERLAALNEAMHAPSPTAERDAALTDVVGRMDALQGQMSALERSVVAGGLGEPSVAGNVREITAMVQGAFLCSSQQPSIEELVTAMSSMREDSLKELSLEIEKLRAMRAQAETIVSESVKRFVSTSKPLSLSVHTHRQQASVRSLKRKRCEEDEHAMDDDEERVVAPMPKRRRTAYRVAKMLVRTATVATVGAVAAWTALAFA